ncbi:hypothetical protein ACQP2Y_21020 [Actinoplanes sp. CA-051413]|uniref:hypothetical protein n=1 Tax=Actinoplanes sp. CA-051413 TaxID=3239899 RepID=UPI003D98EE6B
MNDLPDPWQLYPMPPEQQDKIRRHIDARVAHESTGRAADVAGAIANLVRATPHTDPGYEKLREAYGVALEAAGLVPEEIPRSRPGWHVEGCGCLETDGAVLNVDLRCDIP